jgi:hypothetical protein
MLGLGQVQGSLAVCNRLDGREESLAVGGNGQTCEVTRVWSDAAIGSKAEDEFDRAPDELANAVEELMGVTG